MRLARSYAAVEVHAEGEQGTCYLGSVFEVPGLTAREKLHYLNAVDDSLRRVLTLEPRGRPQASANLVFPSTDPDADAGFVILQADRAHAMSGSNTICVVTALSDRHDPDDRANDGRHAGDGGGTGADRGRVPGGRCERVTFAGVPSFVDALDVSIEVPGSARSPSTWRTAAASTCSSTALRSACDSPATTPGTWSNGPSW